MDEKAYHAALLAHHAQYQKLASDASRAKAEADSLRNAPKNAEAARKKLAELSAEYEGMKKASEEARAKGDTKEFGRLRNEMGGFQENAIGPAEDALREWEDLEKKAKERGVKEPKDASGDAEALPADVEPPSGSSADARREGAAEKYLGKLIVFDKPPMKQELDKLPGGRPKEGTYALQSEFAAKTRVITAIMLIRDKPADYDAERTNLYTDLDGTCCGISFG